METILYYFRFHIGDYKRATDHLTNEEDLAYRRLLEMYYETEKPIPLDTGRVARRLRVDTDSVSIVLEEFFLKTDDGWRHPYCDKQIVAYHGQAETSRQNGRKGGRPKNPAGYQQDADSNPEQTCDKPVTNNHKPLTNNHSTDIDASTKHPKKVATRLPDDWELPDEYAKWCRDARPDLNPHKIADQFKDYWIAQPGAKARKQDWFATWRNWCRNQKAEKQNWADKQQAWVNEVMGKKSDYIDEPLLRVLK